MERPAARPSIPLDAGARRASSAKEVPSPELAGSEPARSSRFRQRPLGRPRRGRAARTRFRARVRRSRDPAVFSIEPAARRECGYLCWGNQSPTRRFPTGAVSRGRSPCCRRRGRPRFPHAASSAAAPPSCPFPAPRPRARLHRRRPAVPGASRAAPRRRHLERGRRVRRRRPRRRPRRLLRRRATASASAGTEAAKRALDQQARRDRHACRSPTRASRASARTSRTPRASPRLT